MHSIFLFTLLLTVGLPALIIFGVLFFIFSLTIASGATYRYYRKKFQHRQQLVQLGLQHEKEILSARIETQEQVFRDISADVHDNIGQKLSLAFFQLEVLAKKYPEASEIAAPLKLAIADLRDFSHRLNGDMVEEGGLQTAILHDMGRLNKQGGIKAVFRNIGPPATVANETATLLYRIFQEALQNIIKHAAASQILVTLAAEEHALLMYISDNGKGFRNDTLQEGRGLKNMRSRVNSLRGKLTITTNEEGTVLLIEIPYTHEKNNRLPHG